MKVATVPNLICVLRIALTVPIVMLLVDGRYGITLVLFAIAAVADGLDGFLAKSFGWTSVLGKLLDPRADTRLLVSVF
jgi:cardiolipin synthase